MYKAREGSNPSFCAMIYPLRKQGINHIKKNLESYRSGHNGAVLKTVRRQRHRGSNPLLSAMKKARFCVLFSWRRVWDSNYVRKPRWGFHAPVQTLAHTFILFSLRRKENASESLTQYNDPLRSNSARGSYLTCIFRLSPGRRPAGPGLPRGAGNIQRMARICAAHKRSFRPLPDCLN